MKTSDICLKFTNHRNKNLYVKISEFVEYHPDSFEGELDEYAYTWEDGPNGWAYYPINKSS